MAGIRYSNMEGGAARAIYLDKIRPRHNAFRPQSKRATARPITRLASTAAGPE